MAVELMTAVLRGMNVRMASASLFSRSVRGILSAAFMNRCVSGLCFPVPSVCDDERGCAPGTICIGGSCIPEVDIPICGELDFDDCAAVDAAKNAGSCRWISATDTYGSCGDGDNNSGCYA